MRMRRRMRLLAPFLFLAAVQPAAADWSVYTSDNFVVYSDATRGQTLSLVEDFEIFRQVALTILDFPAAAEKDRLKIVMFLRPRDFDAIKPEENISGFFYHSIFGPRMMIGPQWGGEEAQRVLFHEYVHYLMNRRSAVNYPRWYSEGVAELLARTEIRRSSILVGSPPPIRDPATVREVIDIEYRDADWEFYETAWLLTHYLLIDSVNDPERTQQALDYVRRFDAGEDPFEAFGSSFGMSPDEMQREMDSYVRRTRFTVIELPGFEYQGEILDRPLVRGEDLYLLGDIAVELNQYDAAYDFFDRFEELDVDSPLAPKVKSRRAIAYMHQDRVDDGDELIGELLAQNPTDADLLADIAHYAFDRYAYSIENDEEEPTSHLDRSIDYGKRALAQNATDVEALYYLGRAHELNGDLQQAADTLLSFYDINPSVPRLNMDLARVLLKGNQDELASYLLSRVYSATHSNDERARLAEVQRRIEAHDLSDREIDELL